MDLDIRPKECLRILCSQDPSDSSGILGVLVCSDACENIEDLVLDSTPSIDPIRECSDRSVRLLSVCGIISTRSEKPEEPESIP